MDDKRYSGIAIGGPMDGKFMVHKAPTYKCREKISLEDRWPTDAPMAMATAAPVHEYTHWVIWRGSQGEITAWLHGDVKGAEDAMKRLVARYAEPRAADTV